MVALRQNSGGHRSLYALYSALSSSDYQIERTEENGETKRILCYRNVKVNAFRSNGLDPYHGILTP